MGWRSDGSEDSGEAGQACEGYGGGGGEEACQSWQSLKHGQNEVKVMDMHQKINRARPWKYCLGAQRITGLSLCISFRYFLGC
mmetsp:Transcript_5457/g.9506  ORF Transcript_5457/g.9506 Transcript_5457/m.9506 type:complete len:83 (-) Transcript_5457:61-309(-)